jgi:hypothetical protein
MVMGDILIFQRNWEIERVGVVKKTVNGASLSVVARREALEALERKEEQNR